MKKHLLFLLILLYSFLMINSSDQQQKRKLFVFKDELNKIDYNSGINFSDIIIIDRNKIDTEQKAPDTGFRDIKTGKAYSLKNFKGKTVVFAIFKNDYKFVWELKLLDKIQKIFPENVKVVLGFIDAKEEYLKKIIAENNLNYIVTDASEIYNNWPDKFHYIKSEKKGYNSEAFVNTNFLINDKGIISGSFKEIFNIGFYYDTAFSVQDQIEFELRKYFESSYNIKSVMLPLDLTEAVRTNDIQSVKKFIEQNPEQINEFQNKYAPIHYAVLTDNLEMTGLLLEHKADPKLYSKLTYGNGNDVFKIAVLKDSKNSKEIIKLLALKIPDQEILSKLCSSALNHYVQEKCGYEMIKFLIENCIKDKYILADICNFALYYAVKKNNFDVTKLLLLYGADPNHNKHLILSCANDDYLQITKLLLENNADIFISDNAGNTPYMISRNANQTKTSLYLDGYLKKKAKEYGDLIVFAKEKMDYKTILAKGFKPKISPDYQFPATQQKTPDGCATYTAFHILKYKYSQYKFEIEVISDKDYGEYADIFKFDKTGIKSDCGHYSLTSYSTGLFFYYLITGEPVEIGYIYVYKNGETTGHYAAAYSFDNEGIWLADSAGGKRHRMSYEVLFNKDSKNRMDMDESRKEIKFSLINLK